MTIVALILGWAGCVFWLCAWRGARLRLAKSMEQTDEALQQTERVEEQRDEALKQAQRSLVCWREAVRHRERMARLFQDFFGGKWKPKDPADWWKE